MQGANFKSAQMEEADLNLTQLQEANFEEAQLQGAYLTPAQMQGAILYKAQLQEAKLVQARLQGANLTEAKLQGANLTEAQLQGAYLKEANLREATLISANFERLAVTDDGEPGQERSADLTNTDFRDADLSNAQLSTVTGLRAEMLAGAVLTNAKLPDDIKKFDKLTHAGETSKHAGTTFFALLAASLYSWLTIGTTTDVALITGAASSPLPIINTNIALSGFYWVAPLILLGVYFYLHLYLQRLWGDLASLPAVFPDGEALDGKVYPWLLNGLVRAHFARLKLSDRPLSRLENLVSISLAWWVVPFTLLAFWLRYIPRHDWWGTGLHVALIAIAVGFGVHSYRLAVRTLSGVGESAAPGQDMPLWLWIWRGIRSYRPDRWTLLALSLALVLSVGAAIYPGENLLTALGYETYAELTDEDVSTKPSGWTGQDETAAVEIAQVKGAALEGRDLRDADARRSFLVNGKLSYTDLRGADLMDADLRGADLYHSDLRGANLWSADLREARAQVVKSIIVVDKAGASGPPGGGYVSYVDLRGASLQRADLRNAKFRNAKFSNANLRDADLQFGDLSGADLGGANLISADLRDANLIGAAFHGAIIVRADLRGARLSGADLSDAHGVTQEQLDEACGDDETRLPEGLTIRRCPVAAPPASASPPTGSP
jgi:uncharacterized protein YjbI with pentapeptide repeats